MCLNAEKHVPEEHSLHVRNLVAVAFYLSGFSAANSQETREQGHHMHDGFYLSLSTGESGLDFKESERGGNILIDWNTRGTGLNFDFKIGAAVKESWILSCDIIQAGNLSYVVNNSVVLMGPGMTYYIMPENFFLSGTIGLANAYADSVVDLNSTHSGSGYGGGIQCKAGKEWWISRAWGVGASLFYLHAQGSNPETRHSNGRMSTPAENFNTTSLGILFNATFN